MILGTSLRSNYVVVLPGSQFLKPGSYTQTHAGQSSKPAVFSCSTAFQFGGAFT
jgi:hypothetical protein